MLSPDLGSGGRARAVRRGARGLVAAVTLAVSASLGGGTQVVAASPENDAFRDARPLAVSEHAQMDTLGATTQAREPEPDCSARAGASVWFTFTPQEDGRYAADTFQSGYDTVVAVYKGGWLGGLKPVACSDDAGGATSYAIFDGTAGVRYRIQVTGERARTGQLELSVGYAPDLTAPRVRGPVSTLLTGETLGRASLTRWSARDKQSGVERFEVELSRNGGAFEALPLDPATARGVTGPLLRGQRLQYRVRAWNHQLMPSDWVVGPAFRPIVIQDDAPAVRTTGTWHVRDARTASGGGTTWSAQAGARLTLTVTGRTIAVVAPRSPNRGELRVLLDGTPVATVDLGSPEPAPRSVVYARTFPGVEEHTLALEVVGTPGRARVDLDAIVVHAPPR